jgi:hypothetical protein
MDRCKPYYRPLSQAEELRREISCHISKQEETVDMSEVLHNGGTPEDADDLWHTLNLAQKLKDYKSSTICLEAL